MKRYSQAALQRLAGLTKPIPLTEEDIVGLLRERFRQSPNKQALARELGLSEFQLTGILRGRWPVPDQAAEALGYRRVTRFERTD